MVHLQRDKTFVAAEAVTAGDILYLNDDVKAAKCTASLAITKRVVGVAATTEASGADVACKAGLVTLTSNGTIAAGQRVVVDETDGQKVIAFVSGKPADMIIGFAMSETSGADQDVSCFLF